MSENDITKDILDAEQINLTRRRGDAEDSK